MSLSELCSNIIVKKNDNKEFLDKDPMEFITAPWGLGLGSSKELPPLYPVQRVIVKCYYGMELDNSSNRDIIIKDKFNENELYRFNEQEYIRYAYEEGRTNRLYEPGKFYPNLVLVIGRRSGKCITGDSLVVTDKGFYRIEDLGEAPEEGFSSVDIGVVQESGRRARAAAFYNGGVKPVYKVKTRFGYKITGTANHRVKVMTEGGIVDWRYLGQIKTGDYICINRKTDLWPEKHLDVRPYHSDTGRKDISLPDTLDERLGSLLGYLVGDGSWTISNAVGVTVEHPETREHVRCLLEGIFEGKASYQHDKRTARTGALRFFGIKPRNFLDSIGWSINCTKYDKHVPWSILRSPKGVVCAFLRGLFETDGGVENGGVKVTFSTASFRLAYEIQALLLNLGITSSVRGKYNKKTKRIYANLSILGVRSRKLFAELIGFDSDKKMKPLLKAVSKSKPGKTSTDSIPHQLDRVKDWLESVPKQKWGEGWKRSELREALGNACKPGGEGLTYDRLGKALTIAKAVGAGEEETRHFEHLLEADYVYAPVESVEVGEEQVYDLTVPDGASFVANGMTNHNTTITSCIKTYELYKLLNKYSPQEYYGIMPEDTIKLTCISTSKDTASELFTKIVGHVERSEFFRKYRAKPTQQYMNFRTQRDLDKYGQKGLASVSLRVAPCSAKGLRGPGNISIGLDEFAFFFADEAGRGGSGGGARNAGGEAIYEAASPSVAKFKKPDGSPDGKIVCLSSPGPKSGKFYTEYERSFEDENEDIFMLQAPTWEVDPNLSTQFLKNKYRANPITFKCEYGAQFSDQMFGWIDEPEIVRGCMVPGLKYRPGSMSRAPHFMGIDVGLKNDGSAITVGHWVNEVNKGVREDKLEVDFSKVRYAKDENLDYFDPDYVAGWIAEVAGKFNISRGLMDQFYDMSVLPVLKKKGYKQIESRHFTDRLNSEVYQVLLTTMIAEQLRLPEGPMSGEKMLDSELVEELLTLQAEHKSKYTITVYAPEREGQHDDLSDSLARMVFIATEYKNKVFSHNVSGSSRVGVRRNAHIQSRRSEIRKALLNRPTGRFMRNMGMRGPGSVGGLGGISGAGRLPY